MTAKIFWWPYILQYKLQWNLTRCYLEELWTSLLSIMHLSFFVVIFNLPNIDWTTDSPSPRTADASLLCEIMSGCFLSQLVSFNTRKDHILDLVLATWPDFVSSIHPCISLPDADHEVRLFLFIRNVSKLLQTYQVKVMEKVISRKLLTALEKSGCVSNNQFGLFYCYPAVVCYTWLELMFRTSQHHSLCFSGLCKGLQLGASRTSYS